MAHWTAEFDPPEAWFSNLGKPMILLSQVLIHNRRVPVDVFFNAPEASELHQAYVASIFAAIREEHERDALVRVQLVPIKQQFPDFRLAIGERTEDFEIVEAYDRDRKRGLEYRSSRTTTVFDLDEEREKAVREVHAAIEKKAKKHYWPKPHLLIYVNFNLFGEFAPIEAQVGQSIDKWRSQFASIWLMREPYLLKCHPDSQVHVGSRAIMNLISE